MRFQFLFVLLAFALGMAVGDRYGVPGLARSGAAVAFEKAEGMLGRKAGGDNVPENDAASSGPGSRKSVSGETGDPANAGLTINDAGLAIIKESEGLRLEAYQAGGRWLIGYGHTATAGAGMTITEAEAERLLREDVAGAENAVRRMVTVKVNRNQFSAMVSLAYNLGSGGFSRSVVLERINKGDFKGAADGFLTHNKAGGKVNDHLNARREKERALFLS